MTDTVHERVGALARGSLTTVQPGADPTLFGVWRNGDEVTMSELGSLSKLLLEAERSGRPAGASLELIGEFARGESLEDLGIEAPDSLFAIAVRIETWAVDAGGNEVSLDLANMLGANGASRNIPTPSLPTPAGRTASTAPAMRPSGERTNRRPAGARSRPAIAAGAPTRSPRACGRSSMQSPPFVGSARPTARSGAAVRARVFKGHLEKAPSQPRGPPSCGADYRWRVCRPSAPQGILERLDQRETSESK
jgi:hypothetical protein